VDSEFTKIGAVRDFRVFAQIDVNKLFEVVNE